MDKKQILELLNAPSAAERLENLKKVLADETEKPALLP